MQDTIEVIGGAAVPALFLFVIGYGLFRRIDVYEAFVEGAAEGLPTLLRILPYLAAMLIAIRALRDSGLLDALTRALSPACEAVGFDAALLPFLTLRPFSGSGAMAILRDLFAERGPDSRTAYTASVLMGSSETIFYEVALYFGAVGVKKTRYTVPVALAAAAVSVLVGVLLANALY